ncbi:hypothetical protein BH11GEM2_BH11GEM2_15470 [soil metagenome]
MHSFHYPQAAAAFREAEQLDSTDVMGYWGEAMSYTHPVWNQQDTAAATAALRRLAPTRAARLALARSPRERAWLAAAEALYAPAGTKAQRDTAWSREMAKLHASDPSDVEATTFYALSLLGLNQGDREPVAYAKASALVAPVFKAHPRHPGAAHYLIHATDDPEHAALGLEAAQAYADIAPSAAHAIHMTSHIFLALGKWDDVVAANRRAQGTRPNGNLSGHIVHWLHYGLIQQGRYHEADVWLDSMTHQARHSTRPLMRADAWDAAGLMAAANLADTRRWTGQARDVRVDDLGFHADSIAEGLLDVAASEFGFALGALNRGETAPFDSTLARMAARRTLVAANPLMANARGMSEVMENTLRGFALEKRDDSSGALALFRAAAVQEASLPMPFGPPIAIKPPREAAGELLLALGKPEMAYGEFSAALARTPRRTAALLGLARAEYLLGKHAASRKHYAELVGIWHAADADLPDLAEVRSRSR